MNLIRHIAWCIGRRAFHISARFGYSPAVDFGCGSPHRCTC